MPRHCFRDFRVYLFHFYCVASSRCQKLTNFSDGVSANKPSGNDLKLFWDRFTLVKQLKLLLNKPTGIDLRLLLEKSTELSETAFLKRSSGNDWSWHAVKSISIRNLSTISSKRLNGILSISFLAYSSRTFLMFFSV